MKSDRALMGAIASKDVAYLPMISDSEDVRADLREKITVEVEPNTTLVNVVLRSHDPREAAAIVNAVVKSFAEYRSSFDQERFAALKARLAEGLSSLRQQIDKKTAEVRELHLKDKVPAEIPPVDVAAPTTGDDGGVPTIRILDERHVDVVIGAIVRNDLDLLAARAELAAKREASKQTKDMPAAARQDEEQLEDRIRVLQKTKNAFARLYSKLEVAMKTDNRHSTEFAHARQELLSLLAREEQVKQNLAQVESQNGQEAYRVAILDLADVPKAPTIDKRWEYLAEAQIGVLFAVLGFFLLVELNAARVYNRGQLSTPCGIDVYSLPPLPTARLMRKLDSQRGADSIEIFVSQLENLCYAVFGNRSKRTQGLCVLVTSAVQREGKSTLACQVAARCGATGMRTLLIDADLRRTSLCALLSVPEGPGLSEVLKGEATIDDVMIPAQGGAFYLLPAGNPIEGTQTIRLFQGQSLSLLITQLRQQYDLIIVDSPPVLPVPDALILGQ